MGLATSKDCLRVKVRFGFSSFTSVNVPTTIEM